MTMRTGFAEGELCWTDLQTRDVEAAKAFYTAVFGWRYEDLPTPDGRSYAQAFLDDALVTVLAPQNSPAGIRRGTGPVERIFRGRRRRGFGRRAGPFLRSA